MERDEGEGEGHQMEQVEQVEQVEQMAASTVLRETRMPIEPLGQPKLGRRFGGADSPTPQTHSVRVLSRATLHRGLEASFSTWPCEQLLTAV